MTGLLFCFFEMTCFILKCRAIKFSQENGLFQFQMPLGIHNEDKNV